MKKVKSIITLLLVLIISVAFIYGLNKLFVSMNSDEGVSSPYAEVFADGKEFNEIEVKDKAETINKVLEVTDGSSPIGYVFDAVSKEGFGGDIHFLVGISNDGVIKGLKVLEQSETDGYGASVETEEFTNGVKDVNVSTGKISAGEGDKENGQITAISGATITTNAMINELKQIVNQLSTLSDKVKPIAEETSYYETKYKDLLPNDLSDYTFEEFKENGKENDPIYNEFVKRIVKVTFCDKFDSYILQLAAKGYGGKIDLMLRLNGEYRVFDMLVASHSETEGLGAYIEDQQYTSIFKGLNLDKNILANAIKLRKNPKGEKDILLISGATVTSNAMQDSLNAAIDGLVKFDKVKSDNSKFEKLELNKKTEESKPKYDHKEKFKTIDESKPLDKGTNEQVVAISLAYKDGKEVGKILDVNTDGFAGKIEFGLLVDLEGKIQDFVVYSHSETEGYGAEIESEAFKKNIIGKNLQEIDTFATGKNIDGISGATFTTEGMLKGMNSAIKAFNDSKDANVVNGN
ncbi:MULTISPECIES: FMN-binding protein [Helcococcus]|uniref:FMN-binding protein n=1 Tax=Helcococcus bovis TaxID=3153252 RepID=A0ABW9F5G9_9FIRM